MTIQNRYKRSAEDIRLELENGSRAVIFLYSMSFLVLTLRRSSGIFIIRPGENHWQHSWRFTLISFLIGWWGLPWGIIYTPHVLFVNMIQGGRDVTDALLQDLGGVRGAPATQSVGNQRFRDDNILDSDMATEMMPFAPFWKRALAALLDWGLIWIPTTFVFKYLLHLDRLMSTHVMTFLAASIYVTYYTLMESSERQGTLGKSLLGIVVTDQDGERLSPQKAFIRALGRMASLTFGFIGFILQPFTSQKQTLHDKIADTLVFDRDKI